MKHVKIVISCGSIQDEMILYIPEMLSGKALAEDYVARYLPGWSVVSGVRVWRHGSEYLVREPS